MTEQKWLNCEDLELMLDQVESKRKKRLFACACARRIWDKISESGKRAVEVSDGKATKQELRKVVNSIVASDWVCKSLVYCKGTYKNLVDCKGTYFAANEAAFRSTSAIWCPAQERTEQLKLLREIFNPFPPIIQTNTNIIGIAQEIYEKQDFTLFSVLHDALVDVGCYKRC